MWKVSYAIIWGASSLLAALSTAPIITKRGCGFHTFGGKNFHLTLNWVKQVQKQYPELDWLADEKVSITEESFSVVSAHSYSNCLFQKYYPEFDRSVLSLKAFRVFYEGDYTDYLLFTYKQDPASRLSYKTFRKIQQFFQDRILQVQGMERKAVIQVMECLILFSDLGKSEHARKLAAEAGICEENHDVFLMKVIQKRPEIFPSYQALPDAGKELLKALTEQPYFGYIAHFEGGKELFERLEKSTFLNAALFFDLAFMAHICDVAGAQGHVEPTSAITYTEETHALLMDIWQACKNIPLQGSAKAWEFFVEKRAHHLKMRCDGVIDQVLIRIGAMMRLTLPYEMECLRKGFFRLSAAELERVIAAFSWEHRVDVDSRYVPAVMINLMNNPMLGESEQERIEEAVRLGLPFLATSIEQNRKDRAKGAPALNFNLIARIAKENPQALLQGGNVDTAGYVHIAKR